MEERYFIKVGNCFVEFLGLWHEAKMRPDYHKASPYLTSESAKLEAKKRGIKNFKVVKKCYENVPSWYGLEGNIYEFDEGKNFNVA